MEDSTSPTTPNTVPKPKWPDVAVPGQGAALRRADRQTQLLLRWGPSANHVMRPVRRKPGTAPLLSREPIFRSLTG